MSRALGGIAELLIGSERKPHLNEILDVLMELDRRAYEEGLSDGQNRLDDEESRPSELDYEQRYGERKF